MYPRILIDQAKLKRNIETIIKMSKENHIENITFVVKAFSGHKEILALLEQTSIQSIGDSRIQNLKNYSSFKGEKMYLRIPMLSELDDVLTYSDISLQSELDTLIALNQLAKDRELFHNIILMFDLGDLREGIYYTSEYLPLVKQILQLEHIHLKGIGTNLTCYGGLVPDTAIYQRLLDIKHTIEQECSISLEIISGGNSSSLALYDKGIIPQEVNHLRLGEAILFGKETSYSTQIEGLYHDIFCLEAQVIECKIKPSIPDGKTSINSFGEIPKIENKGIMTRLIVGIGKQDCILDNLTPIDNNLSILGGSSDHLILESKHNRYQVGDIIRFSINYPAFVHLMNSTYITKVFQ